MSDRVDQKTSDEALFVAYLDDELSRTDKEQFLSRLDREPDLAASFEQYRKTVELLHQVGRISAPDTLLPSVQRRLSSRTMRAAIQPQIRFPYEVLVVTALIASIFYLYIGVVPPSPSGFTERVKPPVVEVSLETPVTLTFESEYGFSIVGGDRPFERAIYVTLPREKAASLLKALEERVGKPLRLPKKGDKITILVTMPPR